MELSDTFQFRWVDQSSGHDSRSSTDGDVLKVDSVVCKELLVVKSSIALRPQEIDGSIGIARSIRVTSMCIKTNNVQERG